MRVGPTEQDALLAVGVVPLAVTEWFGDAPGFIFPWATDALEAAGGELPEVLSSSDGIDVEKVASFAPDLIIGQYAGITDKEYERLFKIAPTIAQSADYADYGAPVDEMALTIGTAVGKADDMQVVVDDVKQQIAERGGGQPRVRWQDGDGRHALRRPLRLRAGGPALADARRPRLRVPQRRVRRPHRGVPASRSPPSAPRTWTRSTSRSGWTSRPTRS